MYLHCFLVPPYSVQILSLANAPASYFKLQCLLYLKINISLKEVSQHVTASHFAFAWSHSCLVKYNGQSFIIQKREVISKVSFLGLIIVVPIKKFKLKFDLPITY